LAYITSLNFHNLQGFHFCHIVSFKFDASTFQPLPSPSVVLNHNRNTSSLQIHKAILDLQLKWDNRKELCHLILVNYPKTIEELKQVKAFDWVLQCEYSRSIKFCYIRHSYVVVLTNELAAWSPVGVDYRTKFLPVGEHAYFLTFYQDSVELDLNIAVPCLSTSGLSATSW